MAKLDLKKHFNLIAIIFIILISAVIITGTVDSDLLVKGAIQGTGDLTASVTSPPSDAVFCNGYEWLACGKFEQSPSSIYMESIKGSTGEFLCDSLECRINEILVEEEIGPSGLFPLPCTFSINGKLFSSVKVKEINRTLLMGDIISYTCNPAPLLSAESGYVTLRIIRRAERLVWCGTAACAGGITGTPVIGADGCTFNPADITGTILNVPNKTGEIIINKSYTVPVNTAFSIVDSEQRHICAKLSESCNTDTDCTGHSLSYPSGSDLFNAEASAGLLNIYGCRQVITGDPECKEWSGESPGDGKCLQEVIQSRCEVVERKPIQCIPNTNSCGTNAFCNPETYECEPTGEVTCTADWQCGTTQQCDRASKVIKKPACIAGQCDFREIQTVECCSDLDCSTQDYCSADGQCIPKVSGIQECQSECCEDVPNTYDKLPPAGKLCCNGVVKDGPFCDTSPEICDNGLDDDGDGKIDTNDPDCATIDPRQQCEAKGWNWVVKDTPIWFGLLTETETFCQKPSDYTVSILGVIGAFTLIIVAWLVTSQPKVVRVVEKVIRVKRRKR